MLAIEWCESALNTCDEPDETSVGRSAYMENKKSLGQIDNFPSSNHVRVSAVD